jgi:hypothetical protein
MAMAARIYRSIDAAFADKCLAAEKKALEYMEKNEIKAGSKIRMTWLTANTRRGRQGRDILGFDELYKTTDDKSFSNRSAHWTSLPLRPVWAGRL